MIEMMTEDDVTVSRNQRSVSVRIDISFDDIIQAIGAEKILDSIGQAKAIEHFGIDVAE